MQARPADPPLSDDDRLPAAAPVVAVLLLAALLVCAAAQTEAWPFTGWELFSRVRRAEQAGWLATETTGGGEHLIPFGRLPRSFHNSGHTLERFPAMTAAEQQAVCAAWRGALNALHPAQPVEAIRIYRTVSRIPLDGGPPAVRRTLFHTCG